jgi:hypothetical protein
MLLKIGVGTGPLTDSIGREQIARIYAMWASESSIRPYFRLTHYRRV